MIHSQPGPAGERWAAPRDDAWCRTVPTWLITQRSRVQIPPRYQVRAGQSLGAVAPGLVCFPHVHGFVHETLIQAVASGPSPCAAENSGSDATPPRINSARAVATWRCTS